MRTLLWCVALAVAPVVAGCTSDEPRQLGRDDPEQVEALDEDDASHALDGKLFTIQLTAQGQEPMQGELCFEDGKLRPIPGEGHQKAEGEKKELEGAPYSALQGEAGVWTFNSVTPCPDGKTMRWTGTVQGESITGTAVAIEEGKEPVYYAFEGRASQPSSTVK